MSIDDLDFKDSCKVLMQEKHDELLQEFNSKKQYSSVYDAYDSKKEAREKFKQFKKLGLIDRTWKRSVGLLKSVDRKEYRRKWRVANKDKMLGYTRKWLNAKFDNK